MTKKYIEIRKSNIPNAGMGAFAKENISKGKKLGHYAGKILTKEQYKKLPDKDYVFELILPQGKLFIDAKNNGNWTRYVNGAKTKEQKKYINVDAKQIGFNIYYIAIKNIKAGDELIIDYGTDYW